MHPFAFRSLAVLTLVGLMGLLTGCDSGGGSGIASNFMVPNTSALNFEVESGETQTQELTLVYQKLSERPAPEETELQYYTIERTEDTGTPEDGSSTFRVTFTAPDEAGSYARPLVFRAGTAAVTIRLAGFATGGPQPITDFSGNETGFTPFNGAISLSLENEQLVMEASNVGGTGVFPGMFTAFDQPLNFEPTPVLAIRMKVTTDSDGPLRVRAALNQAGDLPDANATVPELLANIPADGEYRTYYFDFRNNFVQFDGQPVDPGNISELVLLFNDNIADTFTGTLYIDSIVRRPDIPDDADIANQAPTAAFSFSPTTPAPGAEVSFTDDSSDPDGTIASYAWDFGDGATGNGPSPTHTYSAAGTYTVGLTVTDNDGATAEVTRSITVQENTGNTSELVFDDFEDGLQTDEYFTFSGGGASIQLATISDVPSGSSGTTALQATITGGSDGFAGFGKTSLTDLSTLSGTTRYMNFYVRTSAATAFSLEINLQEDQDGNGTFDGSGAVDDEFQYVYEATSGSGYTLVSIPIGDFADDNAVNNGGDGTLSSSILNIVFAIGGINGADYTLSVDDIVFSTDPLAGN